MQPKSTPLNTFKSAFDVYKRLLPYVFRHKLAFVVVIIMMVISVGISVSVGFAINHVVDKVPREPEAGMLFLDSILWQALSIIVVFGIVEFVSGFTLQVIANRTTENIRRDIFNNITDQKMTYIERFNTGDMQTRIVADTNAVGRFMTMQVPTLFSATLNLLGGLVGAILIDTYMAMVVMLCAPVIFLPFLVFSARLRQLGERTQSAIANVGRYSGEVFRLIKIIKANNRTQTEQNKFGQFADAVAMYAIRSVRLSLTIKTLVGSLALTAIAVLLWHSAYDIYTGDMSVGQLVAFAYFARLIVSASQNFVGFINSLNVMVGKAQKVIGFLKSERHVWHNSLEKPDLQGNITIHNVAFRYPRRKKVLVLKGVNISITAGTHVAIVGASGAGKSTLFDLLLRFYEPEQGSIHVDGMDVKEMREEQVRALFGYVPQRDSLITGTVQQNIEFGMAAASSDDTQVLNQEANQEANKRALEKVKIAAQKAHADEFINQLPQGYDTDLGEVGGQLSGGQKQRIALARALFREPQILLLDEVNSALDPDSEQRIAEAVKHWVQNDRKTVISIAHRMASVQQADNIIVMDNGIVVDSGNHDSLMQSSPVYQNLVRASAKTKTAHQQI